MIKTILEGLKYDLKGEYIDIAKGKYKLDENLREALITIKKKYGTRSNNKRTSFNCGSE
jgi:hypothetical protein